MCEGMSVRRSFVRSQPLWSAAPPCPGRRGAPQFEAYLRTYPLTLRVCVRRRDSGEKRPREAEAAVLSKRAAVEVPAPAFVRAAAAFTVLPDDELRTQVVAMFPQLWGVFRGKVDSERHQTYRRGGRARAGLKFSAHFGALPAKAQEVVSSVLIAEFCRKKLKYVPYVMDVLVPEAVIRLHMHVMGVDYRAARAAVGGS